MMLHRNVGKVVLVAIICVAALYLIMPLDFMFKDEPRTLAFIPHEDPETVEEVFAPDYLDVMSQMTSEELKAMLAERPLLRISQSLEEVIKNPIASRIYISNMLGNINENLGELGTLIREYGYGENRRLVEEISAQLKQANIELGQIEEATKTTSGKLKVPSASPESTLRMLYDELLESIDKGSGMLGLDEEIVASFSSALAGELMDLTQVTLEIEHAVAFVGDNIRFEGVLTSEKESLAGREVVILANSSRYVTVKTDAYGRYQGMLPVPYWYAPELDLQVLYYPQDEDTGVYLTSLSPVVKVKVSFYEASLEVTVENKAYPGLETMVTGRFDYGQSPPPGERRVEIYFDDVLAAAVTAQEAFAQEIKIDPEADVGKHIVTVSSTAVGRYSPVVASAVLNVTRATPILDLSIPKVAMIPGSVGLKGKLYSEVGSLSEASIKMELGKSRVELMSSRDGTFDTKIKAGMGFGLIGSQDLVIQALPQEPWHTPLNTTRSIFMVNVVNCGAFVAILLFLGIYLPGRLRRRLGAYPGRTVRPAIATAQPEPAPAFSGKVPVLTAAEESDEASREPRDRIFHWYRSVVRFLRGVTRAWLGPQQTLREFAQESSRMLGPAAKYFIELTKMVERLLYSQYRPTEKDVENSSQLFHKLEGETKLRVTTQPLLARQVSGEVAGELSTWLWIVMMLALTYYACILLFVLPLLVVSLAS
jgi:hypothetical protein